MKSIKDEPRLLFELSGGLGNQLFQFYAGKKLQREQDPVYSVSPYQSLMVSQGLTKFNIGDLRLIQRKHKSKVSNFIYRIFRYLLRHSSIFRKIILKCTGIYQSQMVGFDKHFPEKHKVTQVFGYFQSYLYVPEEINDRGLQLENPSKEISDLSRELTLVDPIVIHFRGGDYRGLVESFGILSSNYYRDAVELILRQVPRKEIWLFTNDSDLAEQILGDMPFQINRKFSDSDFSSEETLFLMSQANQIVISNSTYSWWGAYMRGKRKLVVAPTKWYRNMEDPNHLIPQNWIRVESSWVM